MTLHLRPQQPRTERARAFLAKPSHGLWIGGSWRTGDATMVSHDPATGESIAQIARASRGDVNDAVAAASEALTHAAWAGMTPTERGALLWRIADLIEAEADALAEVETLDQGKTFATGRRGEIPGAIAQFRYYAGFANKIFGDTLPTSIAYRPAGKEIVAFTRREPIGVVAAIVPWNSPLLMAAMKLAPALCAGCTVVLKPAEDTSLTALMLADILERAGLPDGVVNVVTGTGAEAGEALARHPDVAKITFTGSTATGKRLVGLAAGNLKKLTLELGGKSPAIVMADADLSLAVPGVARGIFANCGQVCVAGSRAYVHHSLFERFADELAQAASALKLGHGLDPESDLGPLASATHAERVGRAVSQGAAAGATILAGGHGFPEAPAFFAPTIVTNAASDLPLMREEIFGPVIALTPFHDADEAIALANDTEYGLAASVWTESLSNAHRMAAAVKAGTVWVNCHSYFSPELPKGGWKASGWGTENGPHGLENYLQTKTVCMVV